MDAMEFARATGGLPGLSRLILSTVDFAISRFNAISANTSHGFSIAFNATRAAAPVLDVLDAIASSANEKCEWTCIWPA
jgi:hypothetical protein